MTLDEVTPEASISSQGPLEIHPRTGLEDAEVGAVERFHQEIKGNATLLTRDGQAAAVHCDAFSQGQLVGKRCLNHEACGIVASRFEHFHGADRLDQSGEHKKRLSEKNPSCQRQHGKQDRQRVGDDVAEEAGTLRASFLDNTTDHEIRPVTDIGHRAEENCTERDSH